MTEYEKYTPGQFCWTDYSAHDMDAARKFYGGLFGWDSKLGPEHEDQPGPYGFFLRAGKMVAGIGELTKEMAAMMPPVWNNYVSVEDCAATVAKAKELGAEVVFDTQVIPDAGSLAFLKDPTGAMFALWQPGHHHGSQICNEPGSMAWNELATRDIEAAATFYSQLFGWKLDNQEGGPTKMYIILNEGRPNGHMMQMTEEWGDMPPAWAVYFAVDDADATAKKAAELGGKIAVEPFDIEPGRIAVIADPQGGHFYVIKLSQPAD